VRPHRPARALLGGALFAGLLLHPLPVAAQAKPRVEVIGDSLLRMTYETGTAWRTDARDGRTLLGATGLLRRVATGDPAVIVAALGTNDVGRNHTRAVMRRAVQRSRQATGGIACVVHTTVSPFGTPFYNRQWGLAARRFNRLVKQLATNVADWAVVVRRHRHYLMADGLHLTRAGKVAYDRFLRRSVERFCPSGDEPPI
jgi:lysophospholipase L1-like esterase